MRIRQHWQNLESRSFLALQRWLIWLSPNKTAVTLSNSSDLMNKLILGSTREITMNFDLVVTQVEVFFKLKAIGSSMEQRKIKFSVQICLVMCLVTDELTTCICRVPSNASLGFISMLATRIYCVRYMIGWIFNLIFTIQFQENSFACSKTSTGGSCLKPVCLCMPFRWRPPLSHSWLLTPSVILSMAGFRPKTTVRMCFVFEIWLHQLVIRIASISWRRRIYSIHSLVGSAGVYKQLNIHHLGN